MASRKKYTLFVDHDKYKNLKPNELKDSDYLEWFWAPVYFVFWILLFYFIVIPSFYSYPEKLLISDEGKHTDEFIGERAEKQLISLAHIGVKLAGTVENDVHALNFIQDEIRKIKIKARLDLYNIEVDLQHSSGKFELWDMAISYFNVSSVVVKISPKNVTSDSYLLMNAHFDTAVGSPGAGKDGVMVAILLETLRVISRSKRELKNPIVFLFNGAEEAYLLGAHGFITKHRWAPNCKVVINLDSVGSGGREVVWRTGPGHPWLMKYYKEKALHPCASTIVEELFQNGFVPSDTDFRIFRDYGQIPGLDMAHTLNGYIFETKYDDFDKLEAGTYQTTGDNVLALTWALANADELRHTTEYAKGSTVFYDFLGKFLISYPKSTGVFINIAVSITALVVLRVSVFQMTSFFSFLRLSLIFTVQIITIVVSIALTLFMSFIVHTLGISQSWYSNEWLSFGLYFCPMFFVMGQIPALFITLTKYLTFMTLDETIACFMHVHCIFLAFVCLLTTLCSIRSAFFSMIAVLFYTISVILNIVDNIFYNNRHFLYLHTACQIPSFLFYTYLHFSYMKAFIPIQGRKGPINLPDFEMAGVCAITAIHLAGFIIPILHKFKKSKLIFTLFGVLTIASIIIARTPLGFPYKAEVSPQRFYILHTNRVIRDIEGKTVANHSGFYIQPVDTHPNSLDSTVLTNALPENWITEQCEKHIFCGLPLYNTKWIEWKENMKWIPAGKPKLNKRTRLELVSKSNDSSSSWRYNFKLKSIDRVVIYINPLEEIKIANWSFDTTLLERDDEPPYFLYHMYATDNKFLSFWIQVKENGKKAYKGKPTMQIGVGGHYYHHAVNYTKEFKDFLAKLPEWVYPTHSMASYDNWYF